MTTIADMIAHLTAHYDPDDRVAVAIWQTGDVLARAEDRELPIDQAMAENIISQIHSHHDASIGISWDIIDVWLDTFCEEDAA